MTTLTGGVPVNGGIDRRRLHNGPLDRSIFNGRLGSELRRRRMVKELAAYDSFSLLPAYLVPTFLRQGLCSCI